MFIYWVSALKTLHNTSVILTKAHRAVVSMMAKGCIVV